MQHTRYRHAAWGPYRLWDPHVPKVSVSAQEFVPKVAVSAQECVSKVAASARVSKVAVSAQELQSKPGSAGRLRRDGVRPLRRGGRSHCLSQAPEKRS